MTDSEIRMPVLKRLAEQAMGDRVFRAEAARDLDAALLAYGYDLNARERELVLAFRETLAQAEVDLNLVREIDLDAIFDHGTVDDVEGLLPERKN